MFGSRPVALALGPLLLAAPASAVTPLEAIAVSPDTTAVLGGVVVADHEAAIDDLEGGVMPLSLGLPPATAVDALHLLADGSALFSLDTSADLSGLAVRAADVVRLAGGIYSLAFAAAAAGVPAGADVDAVAVDGGDLLLSFDLTVDLRGGPYADHDLVRWNGGSFSAFFDGAAAGLPPALDLDAAHLLGNGHLLLSFDAHGVVGAVAFADEDVLEHDPVTGAWELAYDGSSRHAGWGAAGLEALSVAPSLLEIPTLGSLGLGLLALLLAASGVGMARRRPPTGPARASADRKRAHLNEETR